MVGPPAPTHPGEGEIFGESGSPRGNKGSESLFLPRRGVGVGWGGHPTPCPQCTPLVVGIFHLCEFNLNNLISKTFEEVLSNYHFIQTGVRHLIPRGVPGQEHQLPGGGHFADQEG